MSTGDFPNSNGWWEFYQPIHIVPWPPAPMQYGWRCPVCGMVNAPFVSTCQGCPQPKQYPTYTATCGSWSGYTTAREGTGV